MAQEIVDWVEVYSMRDKYGNPYKNVIYLITNLNLALKFSKQPPIPIVNNIVKINNFEKQQWRPPVS